MAAKKKSADAATVMTRDASREKELLAAVFATPEDDAPRRIYADWLLEHGDPRGEFIQIQCELKRPRWGSRPIVVTDPDSRIGQLTMREEALLKKHSKAWLAPVRPYVRTWTWERGFLHQIFVNASFFEGAETVLTQHPVGPLCFEGLKAKDIERFGATAFPNLRHLDITGAPVTEKSVRALIGPNLATLEVLSFYGAKLMDAGITALAHESHFRALKQLRLGACWIKDEGFRALTSSPVLGNLEWLDLSSNEVSSEAAMTLVTSKALSKLKTVRVNEYFTRAAGEATMKAYRERFEILDS